jgi:hypothetical protein
MTKSRYRPPKPIFGPWLLKSESLRKLDEIVEKHWVKFEEGRDTRKQELLKDFTKKFLKEKRLTRLTKEYKSEYDERLLFYKNSLNWWDSDRKLYITLKDENVPYPEYKNFEEALVDRKLQSERPIGFEMYIWSGDISFIMTVDSSKMDFKIAPENENSEVHPLLTDVRSWATEIQYRSWIQMIWGMLGRHKFLILFLGLSLFLLFNFTTQFPGIYPNNTAADELFRDYGNKGENITSSNIINAVRKLVEIKKAEEDKNFTKKLTTKSRPPWLDTYAIFLAWLFLVMFFRPKVELGIGKGNTAMLFWGLWEVFLLSILLLFWEPIRSKIIERLKIFP